MSWLEDSKELLMWNSTMYTCWVTLREWRHVFGLLPLQCIALVWWTSEDVWANDASATAGSSRHNWMDEIGSRLKPSDATTFSSLFFGIIPFLAYMKSMGVFPQWNSLLLDYVISSSLWKTLSSTVLTSENAVCRFVKYDLWWNGSVCTCYFEDVWIKVSNSLVTLLIILGISWPGTTCRS